MLCTVAKRSSLTQHGSEMAEVWSPDENSDFFSENCKSIHDEAALAPMPPCPILIDVLEAMNRIPERIVEVLSSPVRR